MGVVALAVLAGAGVVGSATGASATSAVSTPTSYAVIATVDLDTAVGDGLAIDPEHHSAYVANPDANTVSVIDLTTNTVTATIPMNGRPGRLTVDPGASRAYVVTSGAVKVIDTATHTVIDTIVGFSNPVGVAVDPGTHLLYVVNYNSQVLSVVDPTTSPATIENTDILGSRPWAVDVDPVTHRAYVSTLFGNTVAVVSGTSVVRSAVGFAGPIQVTVDPSTQQTYVVNNNSELISVFDTSTEAPTHFFTAGSGPSDLAVDPGTDTLFVTNRNDDTVSVMDQTTDTIVDTLPVGDYPLSVEVDPTTHRIYVANNDATVSVIAPVESQAITFTSLPPSDATVGGSYAVTATGGGSQQPITFSVDPATTNDACSVTDGTVSFDHAGTCVVAADQAGTPGYTAAPTATQQLAVGLDPTTTAVTLPAGGAVFGQAVTPTVTVTGTHDGSVQFTLDGTPVGGAVALAGDGTATGPDLVGSGLSVGSHPVGAVFTPTDDTRYAGSTATPETLTVSKAATTSSVAVHRNRLTARVEATTPGAGVPTGRVRFYLAGTKVGAAALTEGRAILAYSVPTGRTRHVSTAYTGGASFTGSSASTARHDPVITATLSSAVAPRHGWYAAPVTVTFHCRSTSAALTRPCPAPVTRSRSGGGKSATRTVIATDGGAATVVVSGLNIDRVRPAARITGVRSGATYFASGPAAGCRATDALSGIAACTLTRTRRGHRVAYVATATDRAGNRSSTRVVARTTPVVISGASRTAGHYVVHRGRTYQVLVAATKRPSYLYAAPAPRRPAGGVIPFERAGKNRWALAVTFTHAMRRHTLWNIGTRFGGHTTVTTVRVVR